MMKELFRIKDDVLLRTSKAVLQIAKTFEQKYPDLGNLKAFSFFSFEEIPFGSQCTSNRKSK